MTDSEIVEEYQDFMGRVQALLLEFQRGQETPSEQHLEQLGAACDVLESDLLAAVKRIGDTPTPIPNLVERYKAAGVLSAMSRLMVRYDRSFLESLGIDAEQITTKAVAFMVSKRVRRVVEDSSN